jgi:AraC-like DNA-binding protein
VRWLGANEYYFRPEVERRVAGLGVNVASCPPFESHPLHNHEKAGLLVLLHGDYVEENGSGDVAIPPFSCRYRPAGTRHSHRAGPRGATALHIEPEGASPRRLHYSRGVCAAKRSIETVILILDSTDVTQDLHGACTCLLEESLAAAVDRGCPKWLVRAREMVEASTTESFTLSQIAREVGISAMHLAACYRRTYGVSIVEHATSRRLGDAAALIIQGMPVGEAGVAAGFCDHAYFSRQFKRAFGRPPSALTGLKTV